MMRPAFRVAPIGLLPLLFACAADPGAEETTGQDAFSTTTAATAATCDQAKDLGTLAADTPSLQFRSTSGKCAGWVKVGVEEKMGGVIGQTLRLRAKLVSADDDFALRAYVGPRRSRVEAAPEIAERPLTCDTLPSPLSARDPKELILDAEETPLIGFDDSRNVLLEITHRGACAPDATWTLEVLAGAP